MLSNIDKLHMVEAAVGLEPFRENVLQAKSKLTRILSQEESVSKLLESAEQTLNYWREQYEKYQEKKQLQLKRRFLDRELAWADVERRESAVKGLQANMQKHQESLNKIEAEKQAFTDQLNEQQNQQSTLKGEEKTVFNERLSLEREIAQKQSTSAFIEELLKEAQLLEPTIQSRKEQFKLLRSENLKEMLQSSKQQIEGINAQVKGVEAKLLGLDEAQEKVKDEVLERRVQSGAFGV